MFLVHYFRFCLRFWETTHVWTHFWPGVVSEAPCGDWFSLGRHWWLWWALWSSFWPCAQMRWVTIVTSHMSWTSFITQQKLGKKTNTCDRTGTGGAQFFLDDMATNSVLKLSRGSWLFGRHLTNSERYFSPEAKVLNTSFARSLDSLQLCIFAKCQMAELCCFRMSISQCWLWGAVPVASQQPGCLQRVGERCGSEKGLAWT